MTYVLKIHVKHIINKNNNFIYEYPYHIKCIFKLLISPYALQCEETIYIIM